MIGEAYLNMADVDKARQYHQFAIELAQEGNCSTLQAIALGRKAFLSIYTGKPQEALPLLREAHTLAEGQATGKSLAWIAIMEAEALSSLQSDETFSAIGKVENLLDPGKQDKEDIDWTSFDSTRFAVYKGACYVRLHQPEPAQQVLLLALKEQPSSPTSREALILADLAKAYTQQGEIKEACERATQSLACAARTKSMRALREVKVVQKQLAPWKNQLEVKKLSKHLKDVRFL
jgi:tetratricopeptide (TPR) repeat protein